jgi:hypothetical protein
MNVEEKENFDTEPDEKVVENADQVLKRLKNKLQLECEHKIDKLETFLICDPYAPEKTHKLNLKVVESLSLWNHIYPDYVTITLTMDVKENECGMIRYPGCIFIPDERIMRLIFKAVAHFGRTETDAVVLLRFGLIENIDKVL